MKLYMSDAEAKGFLRQTIKVVAQKTGNMPESGEEFYSLEDYLELIRLSHPAIHTQLASFVEAYADWWELMKRQHNLGETVSNEEMTSAIERKTSARGRLITLLQNT